MNMPNYEFEAKLFRITHEQLQAEIVRLKAALEKYGRHTDNCLIEMAFSYEDLGTEECICGFEEALKGAKPCQTDTDQVKPA